MKAARCRSGDCPEFKLQLVFRRSTLKRDACKDSIHRAERSLGVRHALLPPVGDGSSAPCGAELFLFSVTVSGHHNMMGDDLDWTESLGYAVTNQQQDVLDAIQVFRRQPHFFIIRPTPSFVLTV